MKRTIFTVLVAGIAGVGGLTQSAHAADGNLVDAVNREVLRVCATPANLPYSDEKGEGFENKIAQLIANELKRKSVKYTWFPQGLGFIRKTLSEKRCDLVMGTVQADEFTLNTNHYYRTTYALVAKADAGLDDVKSMFDPRLKGKKVGVQAGSPAADHVAKAGLMGTARPYRFFVDTRYENPAKEMVEAIRKGEIDFGVLWGPLAGFYASRDGEKLSVIPLTEEIPKTERLTYRITMGVRAGETNWKHEINDVIKKRQADIDKILLSYGMPLINEKDELITEPRTSTN